LYVRAKSTTVLGHQARMALVFDDTLEKQARHRIVCGS
jgi:hypothetical protein